MDRRTFIAGAAASVATAACSTVTTSPRAAATPTKGVVTTNDGVTLRYEEAGSGRPGSFGNPSHGSGLRGSTRFQVSARPGRAGRRDAGYLLKPSSSLISGMNKAMTMKPTMPPRIQIMIGSSMLTRLLTAVSTSSS